MNEAGPGSAAAGAGGEAAAAPAHKNRRQRIREGETLSVLVSCFVGQKVELELRNECSVRGTLAAVDENMNMEIEVSGGEGTPASWKGRGAPRKGGETHTSRDAAQDASLLKRELQDGPPTRMEFIFVRGKQVRYFMLPDGCDVAEELERQEERRARGRDAYARKEKRQRL